MFYLKDLIMTIADELAPPILLSPTIGQAGRNNVDLYINHGATRG